MQNLHVTGNRFGREGGEGVMGGVSGWFIVGIVGLEGIIDLDGPWAAMGVVNCNSAF